MKNPTPPIVAALAALALAFSPVLFAQQSAGPDQQQNARADNGTANQAAKSAGPSSAQPGTLQKNDSKDGASETRDANPGTAATDSANQSGTKSPSDATTTASDRGAATKDAGDSVLTDKEFVMRAAQGGMTEVELGKLAAEKAQAGDVKSFGERMVKDHSQANDELKGIAEKKGIDISPTLNAHNQAQVDRLGKLSGAAFDKAYVKSQVRAHESTVELFKEEAQSGQDPDLKAFANKTLPTLQDHCSSIMGIQKNGVK
jgi:putative membrane protein